MIAVRKIACLFICISWLLPAQAQLPAVKYLGIEQGLSNNSVICAYQDSQGYMWFGTFDGLNRYNGYEFTVFRNNIGDTNSLLSNTVYTINGDAEHNIWVGGQKGACVFHPLTASFSPLWYKVAGRSLPLQNIVHQIKPGPDGSMLIATQNQGLVVYPRKNAAGETVALQMPNGKITYQYDSYAVASEPTTHTIWLWIRQVGLCRYRKGDNAIQLINNSNIRINCMLAETNNKLWLGTDKGLFAYNPQQNNFSANYLPINTSVTHITRFRDGNLWIGTDGNGVYTLTPNSTQAASYRQEEDEHPVVKSNAVWSLYEDVNGRKWIGTLRGGISLLDNKPRFFKKVVYKPAGSGSRPEQNFILSFCEDEKQNVWIGTDGAGLRYWNREFNRFTDYTRQPDNANSLSSNFVTCVTKDTLNDIWAATWYGGINRIHPATGKVDHFDCYNTVYKRQENTAWLVFEDKQKNLWASTTNPGCLYRFNRSSNKFDLFDSRIADLQSLTQTSDNQLWGGNYTHLIRVDPVKQKHLFYPIGYPIRCIMEDKQHRMWLGTQEGGLLLFDRSTGHITRYSVKNGLPNNTVLRILQDESGLLWMSTYNGLCRFDPVTGTFLNFSMADGLQSPQFGYHAGLALRSGEFLFGGINGFNLFHPNIVSGSNTRPQVQLSGLLIDNTPIEKDTSYISSHQLEKITCLQIPFNKANLQIDYVNLNYSGAFNTSYAYYLEGWDKVWNLAGKNRKANYNRLHEGTYRFKVKAADSYGRWSNPETLLTITVLPPWYRTWWAYMLYTLAAAGAIYLYIRYTRRQERLRYEVKLAHLQNEKEKELAEHQLSMFTHISHEFRTPLSLIIDPLKKAADPTNPTGQLAGADLATAHRNARRLLSLVDQLLLFRKADSGADRLHVSSFNVGALCYEVFQCFSLQARQKEIEFSLTGTANDIALWGDYEKLEIALFNLLSNAFKFTPKGGSIQLQIAETSNDVSISVADTGCGIHVSEIEHVFDKFRQASHSGVHQSGFGIGLYLVKYFTEKHKGTVSCCSTEGSGTTFTLRLLKGNQHLAGENQVAQPVTQSALIQELFEQNNVPETVVMVPESFAPANAEEVVTGKKSVLIIDDNEEIRLYLQQLFATNYLTYEATNAEDGYRLAVKHIPDLIISDIAMNGEMDGVELCRKVKQSDSLSHIPVILLTAATNNQVKLQGISEGADDYITKPFDSNLLLAKVDSLLKSRSQLRKYFLDSITLKENNHKVPTEYQDFLKRCIEVIESNMDKEDFTIKLFSRQMGMSHSALYTKIKAISGQTLNAFIRSIRIRRAAVLMLTEDITVAQAGFQVGFEDVRYFREQFVKLFGMTPSEYIKKYRHSFHKNLNLVPRKAP